MIRSYFKCFFSVVHISQACSSLNSGKMVETSELVEMLMALLFLLAVVADGAVKSLLTVVKHFSVVQKVQIFKCFLVSLLWFCLPFHCPPILSVQVVELPFLDPLPGIWFVHVGGCLLCDHRLYLHF